MIDQRSSEDKQSTRIRRMRYGDMHNGTCLLFLGVRHMLQNPPTRSLEEGMDCRRCTYVRVCVCVQERSRQAERRRRRKKEEKANLNGSVRSLSFFFVLHWILFCSRLPNNAKFFLSPECLLQYIQYTEREKKKKKRKSNIALLSSLF